MSRLAELGSLGDFLVACRSRLTPDDVGLSTGAGQRRVPGLRREEIAMLAGVSSSYYTRLEQDQSSNASEQVIDAIARALQLTVAERLHLHALAMSTRRATTTEPQVEAVGDGLPELLESVGDAPAMVFGRRRDILAWNATGHALFAGHLGRGDVDDPISRPNATELVFLDLHTRDLYVDWREKALASVGHLRILAAQFPQDTQLHALIGRLTIESDEFAAMWAANLIRSSNSAVYRMRHPLVGQLEVTQRLLTSAEAPGQTIVICTTPAGSPSSAALLLLAQIVRE